MFWRIVLLPVKMEAVHSVEIIISQTIHASVIVDLK